MSKTKKAGLKWPVCTVLILALLGGMIYWGYTALQAEQAIIQAKTAPPAQTTGDAATVAGTQPVAYRSALPLYFLVGFALVMTAIMGSIIYFWWSLKDWEGGRRYGDEEAEAPAPDSDKVSAP